MLAGSCSGFGGQDSDLLKIVPTVQGLQDITDMITGRGLTTADEYYFGGSRIGATNNFAQTLGGETIGPDAPWTSGHPSPSLDWLVLSPLQAGDTYQKISSVSCSVPHFYACQIPFTGELEN